MKPSSSVGWLAALLGAFGALGEAPPARAAEPHDRVAAATPLAAPNDTHLRLLVLDGTAELVTRLHGQLSDVDVSLQSAATGSQARSPAMLEELAARRGADVIVWLANAPEGRGESGSMVFIWLARAERLYSRRIGAQPSSARAAGAHDTSQLYSLDQRTPRAGGEDSATLETAALIVRGAARSVLLERANASLVSREPIEPEPAIVPPAAASPGLVDTMAPLAPSQGERTYRWLPRAGAEWSSAGLSQWGSLSASLALLLEHQGFSAGISGSWGLPEATEQQGVELTFSRRVLGAELGVSWPLLERLALRPSLKAGASWLMRSSRATRSGSQITPGQLSLSPLVALGLALEYDVTSVLRLGVSSGVAWSSHTPRYVVATRSGAEAAAIEPWHFQPNAGLALGTLF